MLSPRLTAAALVLLLACATKQPASQPEPTTDQTPPKPNIDPGRVPSQRMELPQPEKPNPYDTLQPAFPADAAYGNGWMPVGSTGVDEFLKLHPTFDGRGVLIGILDTGIDVGVPGLTRTSTDAPKVLDLRDFSGEGSVALTRVIPTGDSVELAGRRLGGFGRVTALNTQGPYYGGAIAELPLGQPPAADLNGDGDITDTLPVVVTRATDGWVLLADTDGNGSFAGERPVHDYLVARETFGWSTGKRPPLMTIAANFASNAGEPSLDLVFDSFGHGTHVAGIAAGYDLYGVEGFSGVAPGAQLLGIKIALSAQGSVTTTGSMIRAVDYAIRFAKERGLALVLNMSFGVGNEIEGEARIDAMLDSVLAVHPELVFTIAAGNDGPGLSTVGFPGSARRPIGVGATVPSSFLAPDPRGAPQEDQLAFFSSRGGELAKPELVTPGVAYSAVPRWNTGQEISQGTSMAAPHAAGLAALLVSASIQEKRPILARSIKQALMVTATPLVGGTFVDEGTGLPVVEQAYRWLQGNREVPDILVHPVGGDGVNGAFHVLGPTPPPTARQKFELMGPSSAKGATYELRSDSPWITPPRRVILTGGRTIVELRYNLSSLKPPGSYVGTVTGWGPDTLAGPAFRLVSTIVAPERVTAGTRELRSGARVEPGATLRTFFHADSARPFELRVSTASATAKGLAFLHEPDGMPFRDTSLRPLGARDGAAIYQVDGRDAVTGIYESVALAPTGPTLAADVRLTQSPLRLHLTRKENEAVATLSNVTQVPVEAEVAVLLTGGERVETVVAKGSATRKIPFMAPPWARRVVIDISMERSQWDRFTDFGVTLHDSIGRVIERQPLNYAFGRLRAQLPDVHDAMPVELRLYPGFAEPESNEQWSVRASIRLYPDSAIVVKPAQPAQVRVTIAPSKDGSIVIPLPASPWPLGDRFVPLGVIVARAGEHTWTSEGSLPPLNTPPPQ
jgi:subtilisin family serine protease